MTGPQVGRRAILYSICSVAGGAEVERPVQGSLLDQTAGSPGPGSAGPGPSNRAAATQTLVSKLTPDDGDPGDQFGYALAVDGDTAVVGARWDEDEDGIDAGSAYVYSRTNGLWSLQTKLTVPDSEKFGFSVALDGETALVGDPGIGSNSAYVFSRNGGSWDREATLTIDTDDSAYGYSVALDGDTALLGGSIDETARAHVFSRSRGVWVRKSVLVADETTVQSGGAEVGLAGGTAMVGAWQADNENGPAAGSVFVFTRADGEWDRETRLTANDGNEGAGFGWSISMSGQTAIIGAWRDHNANGELAGAAYVYTDSEESWTLADTLIADSGGSDDRFGFSVALEDDVAVIGSFADSTSEADTGTAYVFSRIEGTWAQVARLAPGDGREDNLFGVASGVSGGSAFVGAAHESDPNGEEAGAVYVFTDIEPTPIPTHTPESTSVTPTETPTMVPTPTAGGSGDVQTSDGRTSSPGSLPATGTSVPETRTTGSNGGEIALRTILVTMLASGIVGVALVFLAYQTYSEYPDS